MYLLTFLPPLPHISEGFIDAFFLVIITLPILYYNLHQPLVLHIRERKKSEEELERSYQTEAVLRNLLRLSLKNLPLQELLLLVIQNITSLPWLGLKPTGAIFLKDDESGSLVLKSQDGLATPLQSLCSRVPYGKCLCGKAAESGQAVFANCIDGDHEILYDGIEPHGHYCIPILTTGQKVLGVFTLYVEAGVEHDKRKEETLLAIGNIIAIIIEHKQTEEEKELLIHDLQEALGEIKTLQGILPICSFCKNIRNDEGYYEQIENYIHKHSGVDFSHTICPACMKKHYPDQHDTINHNPGN